jgi:hypothetical protein
VQRTAAGTTATTTGPNDEVLLRSTSRSKTGSQTNVTGPQGTTGSASVTY